MKVSFFFYLAAAAQLTLHSDSSKFIEIHAYKNEFDCMPVNYSGTFTALSLSFVVCNNGTEAHVGLPTVKATFGSTSAELVIPYLRDGFCTKRQPAVFSTAFKSISPGCCVRIQPTSCFWLQCEPADGELQLQLEDSVLAHSIDKSVTKKQSTFWPIVVLVGSTLIICLIKYSCFLYSHRHQHKE